MQGRGSLTSSDLCVNFDPGISRNPVFWKFYPLVDRDAKEC